jgi:membrane protein insertase Oxa1/YidC/SpoIIIJ
VISLIQQDPTFKKMTPDDVLGKIINHEMLVEEAQHVRNLSKGIISSKKQDIPFKATKKSKNKKVIEESSSEEEDDDSNDESTEYDLEEMALFIRRFSKLMSKKSSSKGTRKTSPNQRPRGLATIMVSMVIILLIVPMSIGKMMMTRGGRRRRRATRRTSTTRSKPMVRHTLARSGTLMIKAPTPIVMMWPP